MALSFAAKKTQIFLPLYSFIASRVKSKRAVVALISLVSGILPISGRVAVSAGALDTIAPKNNKRKNYGIIDYLSTHHYYFWSPLEATVILPMAALGLSYFEFIGRIWPLLATALIIIFYYIFKVVKEEDIDIDHKNNLLILVLFAGFLASFALGSSGKFAGFVVLSVGVFGIETLPLFFAVDYAGYMLSPVHKCLVISQSYFGTKIINYYKAIMSLVVPIILMGVVLYYGGIL